MVFLYVLTLVFTPYFTPNEAQLFQSFNFVYYMVVNKK